LQNIISSNAPAHRYLDFLYSEERKEVQNKLPAKKGGFRALIQELKYAAVLKGTRDGVMVMYRAMGKNRKVQTRVAFAFRGTAIPADLVVDAKLALNAKRIRRLDEARAFVKMSLADLTSSIENWQIDFIGHSCKKFFVISFI
jgi:hypothetical protein